MRLPTCLAGGLACVLGLTIRTGWFVADPTAPDADRIALGVSILDTALVALGVFLIALGVSPERWWRHPGVPSSASGLHVSPEWTAPISWRALFALTAIAAVLRAWRLDSDLWLDEITTVREYMRLGLPEILHTFPAPNQQMLNTVLGWASIEVFGEHEWSVRLPAMLFGVASVPALYWLGRAFTREGEALAAAALLCVSYHHVWFSQNARGYSGMILFSLLGLGWLLRGLARNRSGAWVGYAVASTLGALSLLNTAFLLASHVPAYAVLMRRWRPASGGRAPITRRVVASTIGIGLGCLVGYGLALPAMVETFTHGQPSHGWHDLGALATVIWRGFTGGSVAGVVALVVGATVGAVGWVSYWRQSPFINVLLVLPVVLNVVVNLSLNFGVYPRAFLYVLPFALLFAVRGVWVLVGAGWRALGRTGEPAAAWRIAVALLIVGSSAMLVRNYRHPKQDYRGALAFVRAEMGSNDVVCAVGWAGIAYRNYYAPTMPFPTTLAEIDALERTHGNVWIVYSFIRDMHRVYPELLDRIERHYTHVRHFPGTLGDGTIFVARSK